MNPMISSKGSASNGEVYLFKVGQKINQTKWQDRQKLYWLKGTFKLLKQERLIL